MAEPLLRVTRGSVTAEEVAALLAALTVTTAAGPPGGGPRPGSAWGDRSALLRRPLSHGPDAWRLSARPGRA